MQTSAFDQHPRIPELPVQAGARIAKGAKSDGWLPGLMVLVALVAKSGVFGAEPNHDPAQPLKLHDGDRVVLLGGTLIERAQRYGYLEAALTRLFPDCDVTFRNLGWSGDTVRAQSRGIFDPPAEGYARMIEQIQGLEPTVIFMAYGGNEAFDGPVELPAFRRDFERLLDDLAETGARLVLLSPTRHESFGPPLPDPAEINEHLALYRDEIRAIAAERGLRFVDLFDGLRADESPAVPLTDNQVHLTAYGYWRLAGVLQQQLGIQRSPWRVELSADGESIASEGAAVADAEWSNGVLSFSLQSDMLPTPPVPTDVPRDLIAEPAAPILAVRGLSEGSYLLAIDGQPVAIADTDQWATGVAIRTGSPWEQAERLRSAIVRKNELYFHRWRPQNVTYLTGFRKHEQGQHAEEVERFLPLIERAEAEIAELRVPRSYRFELIRQVGVPASE